MKNIGLMLTKNDGRIIEEVLAKHARHVDAIYAIDGSTDSSPEIIERHPKVKLLLLEKDLKPKYVWDDVLRQILLDEIKKREGYGCWVTLLHGDEIYYHDPRKVIEAAEKEGANGVVWYAMHFFLHKTDRKEWDQLKLMPGEDRLTYYAIDNRPWTEFMQFKFHDKSVHFAEAYSIQKPKGLQRRFSKYPIYKHLKVYCPEQLKIFEHRWGGLRLKKGQTIFMENMPHKDRYYRYTIKFDGRFGKWEKGLENLK